MRPGLRKRLCRGSDAPAFRFNIEATSDPGVTQKLPLLPGRPVGPSFIRGSQLHAQQAVISQLTWVQGERDTDRERQRAGERQRERETEGETQRETAGERAGAGSRRGTGGTSRRPGGRDPSGPRPQDPGSRAEAPPTEPPRRPCNRVCSLYLRFWFFVCLFFLSFVS